MKLHIPPILAILSVVIVVSHASLLPEFYWKEVFSFDKLAILDFWDDFNIQHQASHNDIDHTNHEIFGYWKQVLPGTPMPKAIRISLPIKPGYMEGKSYAGIVAGISQFFVYGYVATETQLNDELTRDVFMQEKDLKPGYQTNLRLTQSGNGATFLPRQVANSIPFSSNEIPKILREFSIDPNSKEAKIVEETVKDCERKSIKGEEKYCATSLESMVDHVTATLGKNVRAVSTEANERSDKSEKYVITGVKKITNEDECEVCHKQSYAYAVFYCHKNKHTIAYLVSLVSKDGSKAKAVAICHRDTSGWNPQHLAFKVLDVKPGSVPICHFLHEDHLVWVRN